MSHEEANERNRRAEAFAESRRYCPLSGNVKGQTLLAGRVFNNGRTPARPLLTLDYSHVCEPITRMKTRLCACVCVVGEQIRKRRCKAAFSYLPQHEDELELKAGDVIQILAEVRPISQNCPHQMFGEKELLSGNMWEYMEEGSVSQD